MVRTQLYLTEAQHHELASLAKATGKKKSELIRDAVDHLLDQSSIQRRRAALAGVCGMWKDRDDLPDFQALRAEWDRRGQP